MTAVESLFDNRQFEQEEEGYNAIRCHLNGLPGWLIEMRFRVECLCDRHFFELCSVSSLLFLIFYPLI